MFGRETKGGRPLTELGAIMMTTDEPQGIPLDWTGRLLKKLLPEIRFLNLMTKHGQLDLIYRPDGTDGYRDLSRGAETKSLGNGLEIRVAALQDIIRSKQAAGRPRDLEHLPTLRKLLEIRSEGEKGTPLGYFPLKKGPGE